MGINGKVNQVLLHAQSVIIFGLSGLIMKSGELLKREEVMRRVRFKVVRVVRGRRISAFANGRYELEYSKGGRVRGKEGSFGIAVFGRRRDAESFCRSVNLKILKIIRVLPIGRGKIVKYISRFQSDNMLDVFYGREKDAKLDHNSSFISPYGTIFYPEVEVLD